MMDLLRREHAPIAKESWALIDEQAREVLRGNLSARKIVDVKGPFGWESAAVNLGRLDPVGMDAGGGASYGIRKVQPLVEVRVPFALDLWEIDNVVRGAKDPDFDALIAAAKRIAAFEEHAVYYGFEAASIVGMAGASVYEPIVLASDPSRYPERVAHAMVLLEQAGEPPPYTLVAGANLFQRLENETAGYPPRKQIESLIGGSILLSPAVEGGFLLPSDNQDDFELWLGQDISVGFERHEGPKAHLYLTESFTFRVLEPQAVVTFRLGV